MSTAAYTHPFIGAGYDLLSRLVFAPLGGLATLRAQALDTLGLRRGVRVLELGCGTGSLTRLLIERGAVVTAVDQSEVMLRRAQKRAPRATFERSEITVYQPRESYDWVLFSFVLHELDEPSRRRAFDLARGAVRPGGAIAIIDHALPSHGLLPRAMSAFVHAFEPTTVVDWLRHGFVGEIEAAGLRVTTRQELAGGTAVAMVCAGLS